MQKVTMLPRTLAVAVSLIAAALALGACGSSSSQGKHLTLVAYSTPQGAYEKLIPAFQSTPEGKVIANDTDLVMYLLDSAGVAVVAGVAYGLSPYFRLSIATSLDVLEEGCRRIATAVKALR